MRFKEFAEATGATHRQIDYWTRGGINLANKEAPGSGVYRDYDENFIPHVKLLVKVSRVLYGHITVDTLYDIFEHYFEGRVVLDGERPKLILTWEVEGDPGYRRTNATPEEGPSAPEQWEGFVRGRGGW